MAIEITLGVVRKYKVLSIELKRPYDKKEDLAEVDFALINEFIPDCPIRGYVTVSKSLECYVRTYPTTTLRLFSLSNLARKELQKALREISVGLLQKYKGIINNGISYSI